MTLKEVRGFEKVIEAVRRGRRRRIIREAALVAAAAGLAVFFWAAVSAMFIAGELISQ